VLAGGRFAETLGTWGLTGVFWGITFLGVLGGRGSWSLESLRGHSRMSGTNGSRSGIRVLGLLHGGIAAS